MAEQANGYRTLLAQQYDTYNHYRDYCLTHGINVDYFTSVLGYGNQCWDVPALLWFQYGLRLETGNGYAYGCYALKRDVNARFPFIKVERKDDIKRGDVLCFWPSGLNYTGHICFADENYNNSDTLKCLGQNQGQGTGWGTPSNIVNMNLTRFCGGFRNTLWKSVDPTPPTPTGFEHKKEFPWVLYSQKFRTKRR